MSNNIGQAVGNLFNSIGQAAVDSANAVGQAAEKAVEDLGKQAEKSAKGVDQAVTRFLDKEADSFKDISRAANKGDLLGMFIEASEALSVGDVMRNQIEAAWQLKDGSALGELVSASFNWVTGNPAAVKDAVDVFKALGSSPKQENAAVAPPQSSYSPNEAMCVEDKKQALKDAKAAAKADAKEAAKREAMERLKEKGDAFVAGYLKGRGYAPEQPVANDPSSVLAGMEKLMQEILAQLAKLAESDGPVCQPCPDEFKGGAIELPKEARDEFENPFRDGGPVMGRPIREVSIRDILNDKSLCFEDMIFLIMMKMGDELRKEMEKVAGDLDAINAALDGGAPAGDAKDGEKAAPSQGQEMTGTMGSGEGEFPTDMFSQLFSPENIKGFLSGALDLGGALAPMAGGAIGAAIGTAAIPVPVVGTITGGAIGAAISAIGPVLLPMLGEAIRSGAFDGVFEGGMAMFGGSSSSASGKTAGKQASDTQPKGDATPAQSDDITAGKDKDALKRSREELMEQLKLLQNKLTEMQQALSNVLSAQHQTAMNAIGNIR